MKLKNLTLAIALATLASGCATTGTSNNAQTAQTATPAVQANLSSVQEAATQAMVEAEEEHLKFYAPIHFRDAADYHSQMNDTLNALKNKKGGLLDSLNPFGGATPQQVEQLSKLVIEKVAQGKQTKEVVKEKLDPALSQIRRLEKLNTKQYFPEAHRDHLRELRSIIIAVETNEIESALKDQKDLVNRMYETEIATVKHVTLNNTNALLERLEEKDAEEMVPFLYRKALTEYQAAEKFINANPRDIDGVKIVGIRASNAAEHAKNVLTRIQRMREMTLEQIIIDFEGMIQPVVSALHSEDIAHKDLGDQITTIQAEIRTRETQIEELKIALGKAEEVKASVQLAQTAGEPATPLSEATNKAMQQLEQTAQDLSQTTEDELEISIEDMNDLFQQFEVKVDAPAAAQ